MTVNYTTNLALGQPVTGTESGTWGDDVNNAVTSYLDIAIAGGLAVTVTTADVTLTITQGTSVATNIGSTTAQYAILNVSGAMTAARNLIVPSSSRIYLINNNTTGGFALTVKGSATSGVTLVNGEKAHVFWNGTDYAKMSNASGGAGVFSSITNSGLTSGRVVYSTTGGLETDSANLTFNGTTLTANTIGAFTLSGTIAGGGNQINNVIIGTTTPLAGAFTTLSATGVATFSAGSAAAPAITTTGDTNTGIFFPAADTIAFAEGGAEAMRIDSSGNVGIGTSSPAATLHSYKNTNNGTIGVAAILDAGTQNPSVAGGGIVMNFLTNTGATYFGAVGGYTDGTNYVTGLWGGAAASGAPALIVNSSGNVGIGTISPGQPLHVYSSAAAGKYIYAQQAGSYNIGFQAQNSVSNWYAYTAASTGNFEFFQGSGSGNVVVVSPVGLGYGTGSGGTVTQATDKSTGVTLNKPTGQITMNNAALLPATSVVFVLSNSLLAATDSVIVQPNYGTNSQAYTAQVTFAGAGGVHIRVTNITAGSLSEAVTLSFAIIKGATS